ncbi:hypothetical protein GLOIN_2v1875654 [Rhizophagus irregularis DAOM 181602=DAOM 197198]|uniref:F-box domain-containing protein n=2 Tax=Rhizophagus irregularis TaxID=588596 RepID=A0A015M9T4_RHIIW|nr:hypothetical protein RirG_150880 [Rhizophagus irregularis DAOM 197198w]GBC49727.1 hypothetical protein GLOIN_2v1875654 [Rhizophagus irregularis DAOM 181602=DAOM 197198]
MACSKIFSGDLPELTNEIIKCLRKDFSTLYSCILVNRLWCRLAIPLLWEDPFCIPTKNYHCIEIYLSSLNENDKEKFDEYGIINNLLPSNTLLFNYPSFIKYLNINSAYYSITKWLSSLVDYDHEKLEKLVYRSLLEVFIENGGILRSFEVVMTTDAFCIYFDIIELILQNPNFMNNIKNFKICIHRNIIQNTIMNTIIPLLKFLYSNCNSISSFHFYLNFASSIKNVSLIEKYLQEVIISQHNLKIISFGRRNNNLYNPFLSLKNSNCSNTLNTIIFHYTDFRKINNILQEVFNQLNVLESIHILYCYLNSDFVQQVIKVTKPFKLRSLFMDEILHIESLRLLLQKYGDYLENFELTKSHTNYTNGYEESRRQLLKSFMKYCTKIRYISSDKPNDIDIYSLIENVGQNINYLTILVDNYNYHTFYDEYSSIVLQNLGQVLPSKLEYLSLSLSFNTNDFEIFLKNSQNTFIKKLLIKNTMKNEGENVLFYIKKHIMKKEKVKYLAILLETFPSHNDGEELFFLKDEVIEFKLHNIIVQKYCNLRIIGNDIVHNFNK